MRKMPITPLADSQIVMMHKQVTATIAHPLHLTGDPHNLVGPTMRGRSGTRLCTIRREGATRLEYS